VSSGASSITVCRSMGACRGSNTQVTKKTVAENRLKIKMLFLNIKRVITFRSDARMCRHGGRIGIMGKSNWVYFNFFWWMVNIQVAPYYLSEQGVFHGNLLSFAAFPRLCVEN